MNDMYNCIRLVYKAKDFEDTMTFHREAKEHLVKEGKQASKGFVGKGRKSEIMFRPLNDAYCYHNATVTLSEVRYDKKICPSLEFIAKEGFQNALMPTVEHFIDVMDKKKGKYYIKRVS
ncbi:MAG: hypothetical protein Q7J54_06145 [Candidatus Woesearchaeota archaeon]|nr:hypothetical protein [Candidatus Woesearchaeota archaeon]